MNSATLEILARIEARAKERIRKGSDDLWSKLRIRGNGIRSD
jgi:hypothetical protein